MDGGSGEFVGIGSSLLPNNDVIHFLRVSYVCPLIEHKLVCQSKCIGIKQKAAFAPSHSSPGNE